MKDLVFVKGTDIGNGRRVIAPIGAIECFRMGAKDELKDAVLFETPTRICRLGWGKNAFDSFVCTGKPPSALLFWLKLSLAELGEGEDAEKRPEPAQSEAGEKEAAQ